MVPLTKSLRKLTFGYGLTTTGPQNFVTCIYTNTLYYTFTVVQVGKLDLILGILLKTHLKKPTDFKIREQEAPFCPIYLCLSVVHLIGLDGLAAGLAAVVDHSIELGPGPEFPLPVWDGGKWSNDQEWPLNALHVNLIEECNGLDGLS